MVRYPDLIFVIPCFNEEKTIGQLVEKLYKYSEVLIIDDFSNDNSSKIAFSKGAQIHKNTINFGYHKSIIKGLIIAKEKGYKYCITIDADNQHPLEKIPVIYNLLDSYQIVHTIRSNLDRPSEKFLSLVSFILLKIKDPISGFRGYNLDSLKYNFLSQQLENDLIGMNVLLYAVFYKKKYNICYLDIKTEKRIDRSRYGVGIKPNIKILKATIKIICLFLKNLFKN